VSLNPKIGPVTAHRMIVPSARVKAIGWPVACADALAKMLNQEFLFMLENP
jgi:hypothetical protein